MPRVSQAHLDARRRQILDAARARFARDGFHRTSMDDVIREAGLSAGAVYRYFPSKTSLVHAVVDDALDDVLHAFQAAREATLAAAGGSRAVDGDDARGVLPGPTFVGAVVDAALSEFARSGADASRLALFAWAESLVDETLRELVAERLGDLRAGLRAFITASPAQPGTAAVPEALGDDASFALLAAPVGAIVQRHVSGAVDEGALARGLSALARAWAPGTDAAPVTGSGSATNPGPAASTADAPPAQEDRRLPH